METDSGSASESNLQIYNSSLLPLIAAITVSHQRRIRSTSTSANTHGAESVLKYLFVGICPVQATFYKPGIDKQAVLKGNTHLIARNRLHQADN